MSDLFSSFIYKEIFNLLCGDIIATGVDRAVYSSKILEDCVIKIEDTRDGKDSFQNVLEWETWRHVMNTSYAKWFAPCLYISPNGRVLIMKRTTVARVEEYPDKMPSFLCDFKRANYGIYNGKLVCHDYGSNLLFEHGMTNRMRKANWWDL